MRNYLANLSDQIFAFNVWDINGAKEIINAAAVVNKPVIIQVSAAAFKTIEPKEFNLYIKKYADKCNINVFLHLDHCKEFDMIESAVDARWDSVMIDASHKSLDENIEITQRVCDLAHRYDIAVEGEVGQIEGVEDDIVATEQGIASVDDIRRYIGETDIDFLAAAIGNAHGRYKGVPNIHYDLISEIKNITDMPFVVHGGSGLSDEIFLKLLTYSNVKKINISTEVKETYYKGIVEFGKSKENHSDGFNPLNANKIIYNEICKMAIDKMKLL